MAGVDLDLIKAMRGLRHPLTIDLRDWFSRPNPEFLDEKWTMPRVIQPVYLMGRNHATGLITPAAIVDASARVQVHEMGIVEAQEFTTTAAGNVALQLTPTGITGGLWEILAISYSYLCDATVATRTTAPVLWLSGMTVAGPETSDASLVDTLSLTASQTGEITAMGGVRYKNQAATKSVTVIAHVPAYAGSSVSAGPIFLAAAATLGVAGDSHRLSVVARRLA